MGGCNAIVGIPSRTLDPHLDCSSGQCVCVGGFADCDKNPANGCETDLGTSAPNCGACGHSCLGASCQSGKCQPAMIATYHGLERAVLVPGKLFLAPCDYVLKNTTILELPTSGAGAATPALVPGQFGNCAEQLTANATALVWTDASTLFTNPVASVVPPTTVTQLPGFNSSAPIAASDTYAYWGDSVTMLTMSVPAVTRIALTGGAPEQLPTPMGMDLLEAIVTSPERAYWSDMTSLYSVSHGDTVVTSTMAHPAWALAIDAKNLYSAELGNARIVAIPLDESPETTLAKNVSPLGVTVDATHVYWASDGIGDLERVPIAGGATEVVATGLKFDPKLWIAADDTAVYWISNNQLWRLVK